MSATKGLEGVTAGSTSLSLVDGERGLLIYEGYNIHDLAEHSTFEEVAFLLWNKRLPSQSELTALTSELAQMRALPSPVMDLLKVTPKSTNPMAALRTATSALPLFWEGIDVETEPAAAARRLTAQSPTITAAFHRLRQGLEPVDPDPSLNTAANFLYMLNGEKPSEAAARAIDVCLVLHADHGFNASTFAARVCIATLSDMVSAIVAGMGTLKGPLHGGANTAVMNALLEIGSLDNVDAWIDEKFKKKEKIMGFGHRVYKTEDPRATHLRKFSEVLCKEAGMSHWYEMSKHMEERILKEKGLNPNVDFYSATTYYALGIPPDLYTPIFAMSRVAGWSAHVLEQLADNRLIRPKAEYIGPEERPYTPLEKR